MPKIQELIKKYPGEWLAIEVTKELEGVPLAGKLIYHSTDRDEVWEKTKARKRTPLGHQRRRCQTFNPKRASSKAKTRSARRPLNCSPKFF